MEAAAIRKFRIAAGDGKNYETAHYNLDVIISVGYRVKSQRGTQFRIWAKNDQPIKSWAEISWFYLKLLISNGAGYQRRADDLLNSNSRIKEQRR